MSKSRVRAERAAGAAATENNGTEETRKMTRTSRSRKPAETKAAENGPKATGAKAETSSETTTPKTWEEGLHEFKVIVTEGFDDFGRKLKDFSEQVNGKLDVHTQFIAKCEKRLDGHDHRFTNAEERIKKLEDAVFGGKAGETQAPTSAGSQSTPQSGGAKAATARAGAKARMIDIAAPVAYWAPWNAKLGCWDIPLKSIFAAEAAGYGAAPKKVWLWIDRETGKAHRVLKPEEIVLYTEHAEFLSK